MRRRTAPAPPSREETNMSDIHARKPVAQDDGDGDDDEGGDEDE